MPCIMRVVRENQILRYVLKTAPLQVSVLIFFLTVVLKTSNCK